MKKMFLMALMAALAVGLSTTSAFAQRGAGAKLNGNFGHGFWHHDAAPAYRSTMSFQATPAVDSNRSFSYEPATPATESQPAAPSADKAAPSPNQPAATNDNAAVTQRFSYEPTPVRTYSYRSVDSHKPTWMYPKTDSRRYHH
ncbi:hypothetical protein [Blastopirellula marina]|uniref:Uncharacterized protein n=1 Tax=Blastopirellula marina TaxID=124 RepID=A0A2S8GAL8_9BACT|nr:hypothetical protein [Blastopirellula marina]PQO41502.1 hypothetical protein C5Y93_30810 [Blastopirellula marina]